MWRKETEYIDGRTGEHIVHLLNLVTGGEHKIQIQLAPDACQHCTRAFPKDDFSAINPKAIVEDHLAMLNANHDAVMAHAAKHGLMVRVGEQSSLVPQGHRVVQSGRDRFLHLPRKTA